MVDCKTSSVTGAPYKNYTTATTTQRQQLTEASVGIGFEKHLYIDRESGYM